ncbi:hypothetical protein [Nocardia puris]|uniref:hypothetical protein n=1 Tax=Nocardia puris TaxID=208602 RepID=UPI0011BED5FC|nr:hypothetical protein [Nocardia puris]
MNSTITAGVWPAVVFLAVVAIVTVVALCRAPRSDVSKIFAAFVAGFGFRKRRADDRIERNAFQAASAKVRGELGEVE